MNTSSDDSGANTTVRNRWRLCHPVLEPGPKGSFDETAVKDPSVVFFENRWHIFYTARGRNEYTTGYVAADSWEKLADAPRFELDGVRGSSRYGCAPQIFFFRPQNRWYLIFQTTDENYQPMFVTTETLSDPQSWNTASNLLKKDTDDKWIDFWVLCDDASAYLYYTQEHDAVMVRQTALQDFPFGWGEATTVFHGVHEAVHVYKVQDQSVFHLIYERNTGERSFGLAFAPTPLGPWMKWDEHYATGTQLVGESWSEVVSHGEAVRTGYDERLEYEPTDVTWLIQGLKHSEYVEPYPEMSWKLGIIVSEARTY